ncbi:hypothetical protein [Arthrobacter sp. EpRS71]|uniref:hypothetical protein n=1 Tax=Arthrobacter sp. EpRS71 TaxID=1743141 RepID=UPI0007464BA2|nr:hypothetical protein [Arthrobacter sp. EpRS71]KUM36400.1 hypothetical protein AR689_20990 [Arthrobacter sp. EpRS71]
MSQSTESTTESNPFTKPGFIIAAALVVALIAAAVVIFLTPKGQGNAQPAPTESSNSATTKPSASTAAGKSVCGLPAGTEKSLGSAPTSKWELVGRMATPTDPKTFGPGITDESGFRSCFAQSPTGALYAAMNVAALGSTGSSEIVAKLADKLLVPGTGRDNAMREATVKAASPSATSIQVRGFLIKAYSPSESTVDLAFETNSGALAHLTLSMRWMDGDWKVMPADDGKTYNGPTQIRDLSGFILWSGV